ncbi:MAG TPA: ATP-binding protein [Candidatus Dormibacteraeota bacterium]|nr:ATP-binding protein [Candidatus Dormibacteraeota bacterium]
MGTVQATLQYASTAGFCLLALITLADWIRKRGASRRYLALAIGLLALVSLISQVDNLLPAGLKTGVSVFTLAGFMGAGYSLLLFRDSLVPLKRRTKTIAGLAVLVATAGTIPLVLFPDMPKPLQLAAVIVLFGVWIATVVEPIFRLWLMSRGRPAVQRARLRALSTGYGGIVLVLVVAIGAAPAANNDIYKIGIQLFTLAIIPVLYIAFAPPKWIRRYWREREEGAAAEAVRELLLFSPDRTTLARKSLEWATRLVGADGGLVSDGSGHVLIAEGVDESLQERFMAELRTGQRGVVSLGPSRSAILLPWDGSGGAGGLAVLSGPFTPLFGSDEVARLTAYSAAIAAALERVRLVESLRDSEDQLRQLNLNLEKRVAQRTEQLEASNKELEAFSYTVSHDLRAPLRAINGFSRILMDESREQLDEDGQRYLGLIGTNAEDMGRLIDGLLTFSRLTRQEMKHQLVDTGDVVARVIDGLKASANGRIIDFKVREMPNSRSDLVLLQQVYANLIGNAAKFTRDRNPATIEVGTRHENGETVYFVKDNGVGFDMKYADKLFGVFQRLHRADEYEGTGAGLAIVQRIIHRHGGRIWAESTPGQGAAFYFTLGEDEPGMETGIAALGA